MIHNAAYKMFIVFCTGIILYILYIHGVLHILLSFLCTGGSMEGI